MNALMVFMLLSFRAPEFLDAAHVLTASRGVRRDAELREQLREVVVVPILDDQPARIEPPNRAPRTRKERPVAGTPGSSRSFVPSMTHSLA